MKGCTGNCNQGKWPCNCKGIDLDYGKRDRMIFINNEKSYSRWEKYTKWVLVVMVLYFGAHIYYALTATL